MSDPYEDRADAARAEWISERQPLTLTEFLLARIAEDVDAATMGEGWNTDALMEDVPVQFWDYGETHIGYRRFLAECEAKRRIVVLHSPRPHPHNGRIDRFSQKPLDLGLMCIECSPDDDLYISVGYPCETVKILTGIYVDHPDWREEWRP